ncbi:MAG TPA: M12 family metallo-peptidase, partial [Thermoanaerobaculia bacterium]|nr:M12 family metallo-peptidase [Thermoanaerobaculia bacterium]
SAVLLSVREKGGVQGFVLKSDGAWAVGKGRGAGVLRSKKASDSYQKPFECGTDALVPFAERVAEEPPIAESPSTVFDQPYIASIALETDYEYYAKFNNTTTALDYMGDLIGYADLVYSREIDTDMSIGYSRLWTTNTDPYPSTTSSSTALNNFRNYWNSSMQSIDRTVAHMLSGMETGGGVAWLGVLCDAYGSPGGNYSYGYSGTLDGNFNWDGNQASDPAAVVWDIMVVQHEIGHNFNSPHTHDYCNIGGSSLPIDRCYQGCAGAGQGLPSCSGPTPFFDGGAGTIMSYCHLVSGGYSNQAMTFGEGHTCGTLPGRAPDRMSAHVVSRASSYPDCFASLLCGNGTIDAGEDCDGASLGGATCSSEGFFTGTLACSSSCTFDTSQCSNCGNDVINAGETCDGSALGGATCAGQGCSGGALLCNTTCSGYDKSLCTGCAPCNDNGVCDAGEDCNGCAGDCPGGISSGAVCGNGVCEAGNGEDCLSCAADCNGAQGGKPQNRYCCGDGAGTNPVACTDSRCTAGGKSCATDSNPPGSYCCGDTTCDSGEGCANCALDCELGFEVCGNGLDDDCSGAADCADSACSGEPACICKDAGQACASSSECCSLNCRTKGKNAGKCA